MAPGSKSKSCASVQVFLIRLIALRTGSTDQYPSLSSTYSQLLKWSIFFLLPLPLMCLPNLWPPPSPVFSFFFLPTPHSLRFISWGPLQDTLLPIWANQCVQSPLHLPSHFVVFVSCLPSKMGVPLGGGTTAE